MSCLHLSFQAVHYLRARPNITSLVKQLSKNASAKTPPTPTTFGLYIKPKNNEEVTLTYSQVVANYANAYKTSSSNPEEYAKLLQDYTTEEASEKFPKDQSELPLRKMQDSFSVALFPPGDEKKVQSDHQFGPFQGTKARLLKFADIFAAWIAEKHIDIPSFANNDKSKSSPYLMLTAAMNHFWISTEYDYENKPDILVRAAGHVVWTSTSSLEVQISMDRRGQQPDQWTEIASASFTVVALRPDGKPGFVNQLVGKDKVEDAFLEQPRSNQHWRRNFFRNDTSKGKHPSAQETIILKKMELEDKLSRRVRVVSISDISVVSIYTCSIESRNRYYSMFGGFLLNCGEQAAWKAAKSFSKVNPKLYHMGNVLFLKAVPAGIGMELQCTALVTFFDKDRLLLHVAVIGELNYGSEADQRLEVTTVTNIFHCVYKLPDGNIHEDMPLIEPAENRYEQQLQLNGMRFIRFIHDPERMYPDPEVT